MLVKDFDGAVVLVTGASTGLGRALAVGAAQRGAQAVVVNYARSQAEADETAAHVREAGAEAVVVQGDVARDEDCASVVEAAERFGRIDALFNNAGVTAFAPRHSDLDALTGEDFLHLYDVNVLGAWRMIRAARPLLGAALTPLKAASTAEDIADATLFLGSPLSRHVTGETLLVDAGTHLGFASLSQR